MPLTSTQHYFTKFYLAAFLRAPELGGLNYWVNEAQSGKSLHEVGGIIFSLPSVTDIYPANLSDTDFVEAIYHNVFGRSSDAEGMSYWTDEIASLRSNFAAQGSTNAAYEARGKLLMNMVDAGLATAEGTDGKAYIENRLDVAEYAIEQQLDQGREIAVTFLQDTLSQVNANDTSVTVAQDAIAHLLEDKTAPSLLTLEATTSAHSGKLTTDFAGYSDLGASLIQQADGKLLLAGIAIEGGYDNFALARYNADGTLDTTFGGGDGKLTTDFVGYGDYGASLIQQADGKLLLAGSASEGFYHNFALARYNADGTLDANFGEGDGIVTTDFVEDSYYGNNYGNSNDFGSSLIQQADGKLLLAGSAREDNNNEFALARYNLDGTLDTTFGSVDGKVTTDFVGSFDSGSSLIQQADGKLLLAGYVREEGGYDNFALARYNLDGTLDTSFGGGDGKLTTDFAGSDDSGRSLIQQADGKLLLAGKVYQGGYSNFALARYNLDGTLDTSFGGGDGKLTTDFAGSYDYGESLIQQADGKLLLAGSAREGSNDNENFALARYNLDGTLDTTFGGGDGKVTTDFAGSADYGYSLIQQVDGKLLLAGRAYDGGNSNFALARYNLDGTLDTSFGAERLSALSLSTSENATAGLYDSSNALIGSSLSLSANVAATLEVSAQASVTQTSLRLTDAAGNSSTGAAVALGTERGDTFNLSSPGYLFGFDGDDALTGSSGADVYIGGSGTDALDLGSDSAVDRVLFDVNGLGFDIITGLVQGAGGDVLDVAALNLGGLALSEVFDTNPGAATDISGQVVRLLDISGGEYIIDIHYSAIAIKTALTIGEYANLDMLANRSALVLTAENSNPGTNYLFRVDSTDTGAIGTVELIGVINNADIDHWTADNFAF